MEGFDLDDVDDDREEDDMDSDVGDDDNDSLSLSDEEDEFAEGKYYAFQMYKCLGFLLTLANQYIQIDGSIPKNHTF